ncbi:MAG: XdhC family protein [Myxococcales bacterium]|nr:XdhC family protein [Myxococcales bacterium]
MIDKNLIESAARLRKQNEPYIVATAVRSRRPGSRLLLTHYRWLAGAVSGGSLHGELSASAWMHTDAGGPVLMTYDAAHPDIAGDEDLVAAFGLGDGGTVDVILERAGAPGHVDVLELAARCAETQRRAAVATVIASYGCSARIGTRVALLATGELEQDAPLETERRDALTAELRAVLETGTTRIARIGTLEVLLEAIVPAPRLFVVGESYDLVPLVQLAKHSGWEVIVCADTEGRTTRERFVMADQVLVTTLDEVATRIFQSERAAVVIAEQDFEMDRLALEAFRGTPVRYLGVASARVARLAPDDPRIRELLGDTPVDRAFFALASARGAVLPPTPVNRTEPADRPLPSRPSAVLAAVAAL